MASRLQCLLLTLCLATGWPLAADEVADENWLLDQDVAVTTVPGPDRQVVELDGLDTENFEFGAWVGVLSVEDFGAGQIQGGSVTYHVTEDVFLEGNWASSQLGLASYEELSGAARLLPEDDRNLTQYGMTVGWTLLPGEAFIGSKWAVDTGLYVVGGVGNTHFSGDNRLTWTLGGGYRVIANDFIALHLDVRDHVFDSALPGATGTTHNIEVRTGITLFF